MVGNRNNPVDQPDQSHHYDTFTLEEYVLGQLLPDEEEEIRQHLLTCARCRAEVRTIQQLCGLLKREIDNDLDSAEPGAGLSFDHIAGEWRKPPRRVTWTYRIQQLIPSTSTAILLGVFVTLFLVILTSSGPASLRQLALANSYDGPPARVAAATDSGLVILELSRNGADVITQLDHINAPQNIRFSPDSDWVAFADQTLLYVMPVSGSGHRFRIEIAPGADWAWSPGGHALAYTDGSGALVVVDVIAEQEWVLVPAGEGAWGLPLWTDDGRELFYATAQPLPSDETESAQQGLWRVTLDTGYRVQVGRNLYPEERLLLPAAWIPASETLLAWNAVAGAQGGHPALYRVDTNMHDIQPLNSHVLAQGTRLAWPVSDQGQMLAIQGDQLMNLDLTRLTRTAIPDQIPWPHTLDWAPNDAWAAYTISNAPSGEGLYLFAPQDGTLRTVELPGGAFEKAAFWGDAEHLFVIRQQDNSATNDLWLVPLTNDSPPVRIMSNIHTPQTGPYIGYRWQDVLAIQVLGS